MSNPSPLRLTPTTRRVLLILLALILCPLLVFIGMRAYDHFRGDGIETQSGANVTIRTKDKPEGLAITEVTDANLAADAQLKELPPHTSLGPVVRIEPGGQLAQPMDITFTLSQPVNTADGDTVFVASRDKPADLWALEQARVSEDGKTATITRTHLTDFWPFSFNPKKEFEKFIKSLTADIDTKLNKPDCKDGKKATTDGYAFKSTGKALDACIGLVQGKREVQITNKLDYPVMAEYPGLKFVSSGAVEFKLANLARLGAGDKTLLFSGDKAIYGAELERGGKGTITTSRSDSAMMLYRLDIALEGLMYVMSPFGGAAITKDLVKHWVKLDKLLGSKSCIDSAIKLRVAEMISHCFADNFLKEFFGWKSVLLAPLLFVKSVVEWMIGEIQSLVHRFTGDDKHTVTVTRSKEQPQDRFIGTWTVHTSVYTFNADGTGQTSHPRGLCNYTEECTAYMDLTWTMSGDKLVYTITSFESKTANGDPEFDTGLASAIIGTKFIVAFVDKGLLEQHADPAFANNEPTGNPYLCNLKTISAANKPKCGA